MFFDELRTYGNGMSLGPDGLPHILSAMRSGGKHFREEQRAVSNLRRERARGYALMMGESDDAAGWKNIESGEEICSSR